MKKVVVVITTVAIVAIGAYFVKAGPGPARVLGAPVPADARIITVADAIKQAGPNPAEAALQGEITLKCPSSGCWFYLKDGTGTIRVDTSFAGFNVLDVRAGSQVTVHGKIVQPKNGEAEIAAAGMTIGS